jgi:hypothetical protein
LKFSTSSDLVQRNLQNIYSTPYNYNAADGNAYYCSFDCSEGSGFKVDLLLYHVAAKVDLKWNVAEDKRINRLVPSNGVRLTYLEANHLFNGMAYCFRPLENSVATLPQTGYDIANIVRAEDEGLWWAGRYYFYTILYTCKISKEQFNNVKIPAGYNAVEIMIHPGMPDIDKQHSEDVWDANILSPYRTVELETLLNKNVLKGIDRCAD